MGGAQPPLLGHGLTWQEMPVGMMFRTSTRTVTEADLVTFVTWAGIVNPLFTDTEFGRRVHGHSRRLFPGAATYCLAEGLLVQTGFLLGTGVAVLASGNLEHGKPVFVGDTIHCEAEITGSRATSSKPGHGVVGSTVRVLNQLGDLVLTYGPVRLIRGEELQDDGGI